jgi:hypothetical protein
LADLLGGQIESVSHPSGQLAPQRGKIRASHQIDTLSVLPDVPTFPSWDSRIGRGRLVWRLFLRYVQGNVRKLSADINRTVQQPEVTGAENGIDPVGTTTPEQFANSCIRVH